MTFSEDLESEKRKYFLMANGGISLPAAGAIYWLAVGIAGFFLTQSLWTYVAFFSSGLIFPLGLLLAKPLKANLMVPSPLSGVVFPALVSMFMSWPITIAAAYSNLSLVPLTLSIGMSLHWPVIGWMYGSKICLAHAFARTVLVTFCWFQFPGYRFTLIPLLTSLLYFVTVFGLTVEVRRASSTLISDM